MTTPLPTGATPVDQTPGPDDDRRRPGRIALVSGWQTVNIGDVAHTPGVLRLLERFAPGHEVRLIARSLDQREHAMLRRDFPDVEIVRARIEEPDETAAVLETFDWADVLVHGSGPSVVAEHELDVWRQRSDKPYGVLGTTVDPLSPYGGTLAEVSTMIDSLPADMLQGRLREVLDGATFVFCRDSLSARYLQGQRLRCPVIEFGPDATVTADRTDPVAAEETMREHDLTPGGFFCVVPRLRFTPYYRIRDFAPGPNELRREAVNAAHTPTDLGTLREAVIRHLRATDQIAFVVPEMSYQMELAQEWFGPDAVPADVADRVRVLPRFWPLDEAAGVYRHASAVLSMECHSPLIATAAGTPAAYLRQPTDTIKGQMHPDLGIEAVDLGPGAADRAADWLDATIRRPRATAERLAAVTARADHHLHRMGSAVVAALAAHR